jgi:CRP-like cAMP-binding protein
MSSLDESSLRPACEYQENLDILRQTYFFSGVPLESLKVFAYLCTRETFDSQEYIFQQGENGDDAFCIVSGSAQLERNGNGGARAIRICGPGEFFGGLTLLGETQRLYSLRAVEKTVCMVLGREKFTKTIEQFPAQMPRIVKAVVNAVVKWEQRFLDDLASDCGGCLPRLGVSVL